MDLAITPNRSESISTRDPSVARNLRMNVVMGANGKKVKSFKALCFLVKNAYSTSVYLFWMDMTIPFLSTKDVIDLGPLQLQTQFFFYNHRLSAIVGELLNNLEYIGGHPLTIIIQKACLSDLYQILDDSNNIDLVNDISPQYLSALCHNHRLLSQCLQHYNDTHPLMDNILTRHALRLRASSHN